MKIFATSTLTAKIWKIKSKEYYFYPSLRLVNVSALAFYLGKKLGDFNHNYFADQITSTC
jgi:hypothetical protein